MVNNITKYKKALRFVRDLDKLAKVLSDAEKELLKYKQYKPAQECIDVISNNLLLVKVHLEHNKKIVENKGKE